MAQDNKTERPREMLFGQACPVTLGDTKEIVAARPTCCPQTYIKKFVFV